MLAAAKDTGFGDVEIELDPLNAVFLQGVHLADLRARDFDHGANFSLNGPLLENAPVDTIVGTITGVDPDLGDTFQFALRTMPMAPSDRCGDRRDPRQRSDQARFRENADTTIAVQGGSV